jgi:hypothetical protein
VGVTALGLAILGACGVQDSLLEQQQPQIIQPGDVKTPAAALALYNGALGRFRTSLNGGNNNQETIWNFEGLMTDEIRSADSFSQRNDADQRVTQSNDGVMGFTYSAAQQSRGFARDAINALKLYSPTETTKIAEMYLELGFFEMSLGQGFCNGIPLGETVAGVPNYTAPLTNAQVFTTAIARFDSALTLLTGTDAATIAIRNATLIAKGRAQVDLGQFAAAATTVAPVPLSYTYLITYSQTTTSNEWWQMFASSKRYSVGDSVDPSGIIKNAIPFFSSKDPRVLTKAAAGVGLDTTTPFTDMTNWGREDALSLVNGLDGQLIQAEAKLQANDIVGMNTILNTLRATPPKYGNLTIAAMAALPVPATQTAAIDQYFREKAFWQYGRGERFEDLRRLMRQYGRTQDNVWPTGAYFKNGSYGTNVTFPVPDAEKQNPNFTGCLDTKA